MQRRSFLLGASQALVFALAAPKTDAASAEQQPTEDLRAWLEERIAGTLRQSLG